MSHKAWSIKPWTTSFLTFESSSNTNSMYIFIRLVSCVDHPCLVGPIVPFLMLSIAASSAWGRKSATSGGLSGFHVVVQVHDGVYCSFVLRRCLRSCAMRWRKCAQKKNQLPGWPATRTETCIRNLSAHFIKLGLTILNTLYQSTCQRSGSRFGNFVALKKENELLQRKVIWGVILVQYMCCLCIEPE